MARAQQNEKAATVRTASTSRGVRTRPRTALAALVASALAIAWAGVELAGAGTVLYAYGFFFTEFFAGVVALVSLSLTVMMGLLATDRLVMGIRHRVLLQSAHRATGILGVAGLVFHVITKIAIGRAGPTDALVPFVGGRGLYVGLGTVAAFLMVSVLWTGLIRVRFAGVGPKWFWRALHSMAYVSWPFALVHGLNAGRAAKPWVVLSYLACVLLVVVALLVRASVHLGKRSREQHQAAALNQAMAGRPTEESRGLLAGLGRKRSGDGEKKESRGAGRAGGWAETTATSWGGPAGTARRRDPDRFTVPVVPEPGSLREPVRATTRRRRAEDLEPAARRRDDEPRREEREPVVRRADAERSGRRYRDEEEAPTRRSRADARYSSPPRAAEPEEPWDSPRRWESDERPVSAEPISAGPISAAPRSGGGRHSAEDEVPVEADYWRPPASYVPDDVPVDDTPTLVDLASRRALRAAGEARSSRRRRASADAVDGAYWAGLRGEAK
ncbi:ferric reductase-like transmembrane domain-containing protein [Micromonospora mangrovi]|uniref:Ferric reductase-like transmembrane domain-containing protein n=2 Tax=Micromonospora TaxID=1873 RepID=A0AAU8HE75_9ACTN